MEIKELKKLVKACRALGVKTLKTDQVDLTLTDEAPLPRQAKKRSISQPEAYTDPLFDSDAPTEQELLFWSSTNPINEDSGEQ